MITVQKLLLVLTKDGRIEDLYIWSTSLSMNELVSKSKIKRIEVKSKSF